MEPIIALATPPLVSALAIIRACGDGIFAITEKLLGKKIDIDAPKIIHGTLVDQGKPLDEVVLLCFPKGKSANGEETVEISCHGSPLVADEIIEAYLSKGVRLAVNGEFSARAYYNGKIDLVQAEAINDLIRACTREQKALAFKSLNGETSKLLEPLKNGLSELLAAVEVSIDFPEYDEGGDAMEIKKGCLGLIGMIDGLYEEGQQGNYLRNGINVVLLGEPNVGKSSILNALLEEEKAIVSPVAGTTRDVVEGDISIKGIPVHLLDTAGIREANDDIEALGIKKSEEALSKADVVVLISDERGKTEEYEKLKKSAIGKPIIEIVNKIDLQNLTNFSNCGVSAINRDVAKLKQAIFDALHLNDQVYTRPSLSSQRELSLLRMIKENLITAVALCDDGLDIGLVASQLQMAYNNMRSILGLNPTQDIGDEIFSRFCVGK